MTENKTDSKPRRTLCPECEHLLIEQSNWDKQNKVRVRWYDQYCKAIKIPLEIDPTTGKRAYRHVNDLGRGVYDPDEAYHNCRDINDGNCKYFKKAEPKSSFYAKGYSKKIKDLLFGERE